MSLPWKSKSGLWPCKKASAPFSDWLEPCD
jgi:hypothetical protein